MHLYKASMETPCFDRNLVPQNTRGVAHAQAAVEVAQAAKQKVTQPTVRDDFQKGCGIH